MEEVNGPTLLAQVAAQPRAAAGAGALVAAMHHLLDDVPGHPGLPFRHTTSATAGTDEDGPGRLLHGDLHPGNIIAAPHGPVLIDFTDAGCGPRAADVADAASRHLRAVVDRRHRDPHTTQVEQRAMTELVTRCAT